jgi:hypothetical protein
MPPLSFALSTLLKHLARLYEHSKKEQNLMFNDNVSLFDVSSIHDAKMLKDALSFYGAVTRIEINLQYSSFNAMNERHERSITQILLFQVQSFNKRMKYLGFIPKVNEYGYRYWLWL